MTTIRGLLLEHNGAEYLVAIDDNEMPDLLRRGAAGWEPLKRSRKAKEEALAILRALGGEVDNGDHTQRQIMKLLLMGTTDMIQRFFKHARW